MLHISVEDVNEPQPLMRGVPNFLFAVLSYSGPSWNHSSQLCWNESAALFRLNWRCRFQRRAFSAVKLGEFRNLGSWAEVSWDLFLSPGQFSRSRGVYCGRPDYRWEHDGPLLYKKRRGECLLASWIASRIEPRLLLGLLCWLQFDSYRPLPSILSDTLTMPSNKAQNSLPSPLPPSPCPFVRFVSKSRHTRSWLVGSEKHLLTSLHALHEEAELFWDEFWLVGFPFPATLGHFTTFLVWNESKYT